MFSIKTAGIEIRQIAAFHDFTGRAKFEPRSANVPISQANPDLVVAVVSEKGREFEITAEMVGTWPGEPPNCPRWAKRG